MPTGPRRIVFGPVIAPAAWAIGESLLPEGSAIEVLSKDEKERVEQFETAEFYMGFRGGLTASDYDHMGNLKLIQFLSAGYDGVDLEKLRELGIPLSNNGGANSYAVAEHAILLMLAVVAAASRPRSPREKRQVEVEPVRRGGGARDRRQDDRHHRPGHDRQDARAAPGGFEVKLLYTDPVRPTPEEAAKLNVSYRELDDLLRESDIVTLHAPFDATTHHIINERSLKLMKRDSILINCARGELVDEAALYSALKDGTHLGRRARHLRSRAAEARQSALHAAEHRRSRRTPPGPTWESWPKRFGNSYANVQRVARGEEPLWVVPELRGAR